MEQTQVRINGAGLLDLGLTPTDIKGLMVHLYEINTMDLYCACDVIDQNLIASMVTLRLAGYENPAEMMPKTAMLDAKAMIMVAEIVRLVRNIRFPTSVVHCVLTVGMSDLLPAARAFFSRPGYQGWVYRSKILQLTIAEFSELAKCPPGLTAAFREMHDKIRRREIMMMTQEDAVRYYYPSPTGKQR